LEVPPLAVIHRRTSRLLADVSRYVTLKLPELVPCRTFRQKP
jgi:hypothetical protein